MARSPRAVPWEKQLPWASVMIVRTAAADLGRGFACAKGVDKSTSRFLREHGDQLSREALLLCLFLAAVADRHGLSFYSDTTLSLRLRLTLPVLAQAREELLERDLLASQLPLVQVLSLPAPGVRRRAEPGQGLLKLGDLFRQLGVPASPKPQENTP